VKRREFIAGLGAAAVWPPVARAQRGELPVIGLLNGVSFEAYAPRIAAFREGLKERGFVEGQNVSVIYRSANGQDDRLPALASDLVSRRVTVIVAIGGEAAPLAAKKATATIPIVFATGGDALADGLVDSLSRPSANVTGVTFLSTTLGLKRLGLLRDVLPSATLIGLLANSNDWGNRKAFDDSMADVSTGAKSLGSELFVFDAGTDQRIEDAFEAMVQRRIAALLVNADAFLSARKEKIVSLAARYAIPTVYSNRENVRGGGLMSYGVELSELYRQAGSYTGRILKGAKPADLPVLQPTRFEFVVNLKTATALGLDLPSGILAIADEVVE
jgi:putative tryptophan/tyrosine transport system substrate-binding protein